MCRQINPEIAKNLCADVLILVSGATDLGPLAGSSHK